MSVRVLSPLRALVIACVLTRTWSLLPTTCCNDLKAAFGQLQESVRQLQHQATQQNKAIASLLDATCCNYELLVTTGTMHDADIDSSHVYAQLYDGHVATRWYHLDTPADDFERGRTDTFRLKDKCLINPCVRLKTILVPHRVRDWWYCTKVQLKVLDCHSNTAREYHYTFNVGFVANVESRCPQ